MLICHVLQINEGLSVDSSVQWFTTEVVAAYKRAYAAAKATYESSENPKLARMHGGGALGKWFATNTINPKGPSIELLLNVLRPHNIELPALLGTSKQREEAQYSNSGNLQKLVSDIIPVLDHKGFSREARYLARAQEEYKAQMIRLLASAPEDDVVSASDTEDYDISHQYSAAEKVVMNTIKMLPPEIQSAVRKEVSKRGNSLSALRDVLQSQYGINL